jgi:hypothetical protein
VAAIIFNMKKISGSFTLVLLAFAICVVGCKEPEVAPPPLVEHHTTIDGKLYGGYVISEVGNENCENVFVTTHNLATENIAGAGEYWSGKLAWEVEFKLSQYGHPISVRYLEKNPNYGHGLVFLPPNFNPMSTFRISDFHYDSTTGEISFSYEGTVFYDRDNTVTREIQGSVYIESSRSIECEYGVTGLYYTSDELNLFSETLSRTKYSTGRQTHRFITPDGYRIYLWTLGDLWNYPLGEEMEFVPNDYTKDWVEFAEVDRLFAAQVPSVDQVPWKEYETSGTIVLENKYIENGDPMISGKMYLTIRDEGKQLYYLDGVSFRTGSWEEP